MNRWVQRTVIGLAGIAILTASPAYAQEPTDPGVAVRIFTSDSVLTTVKRVAKVYQAKHPDVRVTVRGGGSLHACWQLGIGRADLAVSEGPQDILQHRGLDTAGKKVAPLKEYFRAGQLQVFPLARHALAVAVHPQSGIDRMDDATLKSILAVLVNKHNPDPLASANVRYIRDGYACSHEMIRVLLNEDGHFTIGNGPIIYPVSKLLQSVAADKSLVALTRVDEALWSSGLKVLPVEVTRGQQAIKPTVANVLSGVYPYQTHLLAAVHPEAPAEALEFACLLQEPEVAGWLAEQGWITVAAKDPAPAEESVWPAALEIAADDTVRGAVAVLPTRLLTSAFLVGDTSLYAAYEDQVVEAIRRDGRLSLLDREHLAKALGESAMGAGRSMPVVAADVLVILQVTTEQSVTFLRIQAFHSATATLLGEMKLPIDPSRPTEFKPALETRVAAWWPGLLRNLQAARTRPVWTVRPTGDDVEAARKHADVAQADLQRQECVFVARYAGLSATQQEALIALMGLARSQGASQLPAADYLMEVRTDNDGQINLCIRRGNDLRTIAQESFRTTGKEMNSWIRAQATLSLSQQRTARAVGPEDEEAAKRQSEEELRQAAQFGHRHSSLVARLAGEYSGPSEWPEAVRHELDALLAEEFRAYERAAQLDPSREEALLGVARGLDGRFSNSWRKPDRLELLLSAIRADEQFLASFGRSSHRAEILAQHIQHCRFASESASAGLGPQDQLRVRTFFLAKAVDSCEEYLDEPPSKEASRKDRYRPTWSSFHAILTQYLPILEPQTADAIVQDWAKRHDQQDSRALHSDFLRLILLGNRKDRSHYRQDRSQYIALVAKMQKRWPDPKHFQWQQAGRMVSETLGRLCGGDRSFVDWLDGQRGIGDLPYPGFDPDHLMGHVRVLCLGYRAPISWAVESFREVQRDVSVWLLEPNRDDVGRFLRGEAGLFYYVGTLDAEDAKRLRDLCGEAFPGRLLGNLPPPDPQRPDTVQRGAAASDAVHLLVHPQAEEQVRVFADWLSTTPGQKAMATYFLVPASPSASGPATIP